MKSHQSGKAAVAVVALVAVILGIFAGLLLKDFLDSKSSTDLSAQLTANMLGMGAAKSTNGLDSRFTDANGDLIADAPADAGTLVDPPVLNFSYVGVEDPSEFQAAFGDLMKKLSQATGKPVQYLPVTSTEEQLQALHDGRLQITGLGTGAVPVAVDLAGFVPVATFGDDKGAATYHVVFIVNRSSPIQKLSDLAGRELTLTEPNSMSGFRAPLVVLQTMGMQAGRDFGVRYSQGHLQSIKGIKDGKYEIAAVTSDLLQRELAVGAIGANDFRTVYTSQESFPSAAFGYVYNLKPELAAKIRDVLKNADLKGTTGEAMFSPEGKTRLLPVDFKKDWDHVLTVDTTLGVKYTIPTPEAPATGPTTAPTTLPAAMLKTNLSTLPAQSSATQP